MNKQSKEKIMKRVSKLEKFIYKLKDKYNLFLRKLFTCSIGVGIDGDSKIDFEKDIIKLLQKYNLYSIKNAALQKVEIIVDTGKMPRIKTKYVVIDRPEENEQTKN